VGGSWRVQLMLKGTKLKIASNIAVADAMQANTAAINNQAKVQQKSNELYQKDLETKDRVDISLKEYSDLKYKESQLYGLENAISTLLEVTGLTLNELSSISRNNIMVCYAEDPMNMKFALDLRLNLNLPRYRQRELLNYFNNN
jgi:hypothetical protein